MDEIASFFPQAARPVQVDLGAWEGPVAKDPASGYRAVSAEVRAALEHRLWADATQRLLERLAADAPQDAPRLADQASAQLPDRPLVARRLLDEGLATAARNLGSLRRADVEAMARLYREKLDQPERPGAGPGLARRPAPEPPEPDRRRGPLPPGGPVRVDARRPGHGDRAAPRRLEDRPPVEGGGRRLSPPGFRKVNEEWVEPPRSRDAAVVAADEPSVSALPADVTLRNKSPREVRARLGGKPNRVVWSASQGQMIEQWIYLGPTLNQYVNFLHSPASQSPRSSPTTPAPEPPPDPFPHPDPSGHHPEVPFMHALTAGRRFVKFPPSANRARDFCLDRACGQVCSKKMLEFRQTFVSACRNTFVNVRNWAASCRGA